MFLTINISGKLMKYPKHLALVIAKASSALENNVNSTVYKNLFADLLRKPPYQFKSDVTSEEEVRKVLILSTWSAGLVCEFLNVRYMYHINFQVPPFFQSS